VSFAGATRGRRTSLAGVGWLVSSCGLVGLIVVSGGEPKTESP
jgi:hypothetical protein